MYKANQLPPMSLKRSCFEYGQHTYLPDDDVRNGLNKDLSFGGANRI